MTEADRKHRLAAKLRENLRKRKVQAKARALEKPASTHVEDSDTTEKKGNRHPHNTSGE